MHGMFRTTQIVLGSLVLLIMFLGWLGRRHPQIVWLRVFDMRAKLTDDQRRRLQRTVDMNAGLQLILLGLALPVVYVVLTTMFFGTFAPRGIAFVAAGSLACIVTGLVGVIRTRRR